MHRETHKKTFTKFVRRAAKLVAAYVCNGWLSLPHLGQAHSILSTLAFEDAAFQSTDISKNSPKARSPRSPRPIYWIIHKHADQGQQEKLWGKKNWIRKGEQFLSKRMYLYMKTLFCLSGFIKVISLLYKLSQKWRRDFSLTFKTVCLNTFHNSLQNYPCRVEYKIIYYIPYFFQWLRWSHTAFIASSLSNLMCLNLFA